MLSDNEKFQYQFGMRYVWDDPSVLAAHKDNAYYARFRCQQVLSEADVQQCRDWQWKLGISQAEMERRGLL